MRTKFVLYIAVAFGTSMFSQSVATTQMINARATGYAIIAARNPGVQFSVLVIPWDKANTLEYNANMQINSAWHPQAVIKGNYFDQGFDGSDFTSYSTVLVRQEDFDKYKGTGTQWWIVCSTLPPFSSAVTSADGRVGIGTSTPRARLDVSGVTLLGGKESDIDSRLVSLDWLRDTGKLLIGTNQSGLGETDLVSNRGSGSTGGFGFFDLTNEGALDRLLYLRSNGDASLQGKFEAKELRVTMTPTADFVFDNDYHLPKLRDTERYIAYNHHLPEIPSAGEMKRKGVNVGEFQIMLLRKIEELTLYLLQQDKKIDEQHEEILKLKKVDK